MKILIVEDEQRAREGLAKLFSAISDGYEVVGKASNGQVALDMIQKLEPDVIFTDVKMPIMDGITLTKYIRDKNINVEIVVVSAYGEFELVRPFISLDVADYLLKPVTREELEKTLRKLEERKNGNFYSQENNDQLRKRYPEAHPMILKTLDIIQENFADKISQKELAARLDVSAEYFSYLFTKNTGANFSTFLRDYRMEQAKRMLRNKEVSKKDVPYACGFTDPKYFGQVFKKVVGMSPSEYVLSLKE